MSKLHHPILRSNSSFRSVRWLYFDGIKQYMKIISGELLLIDPSYQIFILMIWCWNSVLSVLSKTLFYICCLQHCFFFVFFFVLLLSYYVSLRSELRGVMSVMIFAWKRWSARLYLQFLRGLKSYWRYMCLFAHSAVQDILCCVFFLLSCVPYVASFSRLSMFIAPSEFSNVYWFVLSRTLVYLCCWELCFVCVAYITLAYL